MKILISEHQLKKIILNEEPIRLSQLFTDLHISPEEVTSKLERGGLENGEKLTLSFKNLLNKSFQELTPEEKQFISAILRKFNSAKFDKFSVDMKALLDKAGVNMYDRVIGDLKSGKTSPAQVASFVNQISHGKNNLESGTIQVWKDYLNNTSLNIVDKSINTANKNQYIKTFGQSKYEALLQKVMNGTITKQQFTDELTNSLKNSYENVNFATVAGVKFSEQEQSGIEKVAKAINTGTNNTTINIQLVVDGQVKNIPVIIKSFGKTLWKAGAYKDQTIYCNFDKLRVMTLNDILNSISHEAAHIKDKSILSDKMTKDYEGILSSVTYYNKLWEKNHADFGENAPQTIEAQQKYAQAFTKYKYHYKEMLANNSMVVQSVARNVRPLIGEIGVPETRKIVSASKFYITKGLPPEGDYFLNKLMGISNIRYVRQIKTFDENLFKDLLKKLTIQVNHIDEQLKLYQQH